jgi:photosystem II stability/assembly factor-like uncharacterized protein
LRPTRTARSESYSLGIGPRLLSALIAVLCSALLLVVPGIFSAASASSAAGTAGRPTWTTRVVPSGVDTLNDVACPSASRCYAVGGHGTTGPGSIIGSSDGGDHWKALMTTPEAAQLLAIACPKPSTCVVAGERPATGPNGQPAAEVSSTPLTEHPVAFLTTDGGSHWSNETLPKVGGVDGAACVSVNVCLVIGYAEGIARTTNGGRTWVMEKTPRRFDGINSVSCPTRSFCILGGTGTGSNSSVPPSADSVSQDAGATWSRAVVVAGPVRVQGGSIDATALGALSCSSSRHCVGLIGGTTATTFFAGSPMVTSDGGRTWTRESRRVGWADSCVGNFCISVGGDLQPLAADAFVSTDGGAHWSPSSIRTRLIPTAVSCTSSTHCVAVGGNFPMAKSAVIVTYS